jgi:mRNA interferase MazF
VDRVYPSEAEVRFKGKDNKAMADQLATVSKQRLIGKGGVLSKEDMSKIEKAIKLQLNLG